MKTVIDAVLSHAYTKGDGIELINDTIRELITKMASQHPDHVAYIFEQNASLEITYSQLKRRVETMARNLLALGFQKGDRFAFMLPYTVETMITVFSCAYIGVISVPIDPWWCLQDLEFALKLLNPKGLILTTCFENVYYFRHFKDFCPEIASCSKGELVSESIPALKHVILARKLENHKLEEEEDVVYENAWDIDEIIKENPELSKSNVTTDWPELNPHDPYFMVFTSGTTGGKKKAAVSTFHKFINDTHVYMSVFGDRKSLFYDNYCYMMSLNFVASQICGILPSLLHKARVVYPSLGRSALNTVRAIQKHKCQGLMAAPKLLFEIFDSAELSKGYDLSSLRSILSGSQIVAAEIVERVFERLSEFECFANIYGQTELLISNMLLVTDPKSRPEASLSVGFPIPFVEQKVVDPVTKQIVPKNTPGELYTKSFAIFSGYLNDPEKTKEAIDSDGWMVTGDLVYMNDEGYVYFKNRIKEVINFGDLIIFPSEVESVLRGHENIADAYVFSIVENEVDKYGCAWIVLKDKSKTTTVEELQLMCGKRVLEFVKFVDDVPVSENGKTLKIEMSRLYKIELGL